MVDRQRAGIMRRSRQSKKREAQGDWRLEECELYDVEPCLMCAGAIVKSGSPKVYIGSMNLKAAAVIGTNLSDEKDSIIRWRQKKDFGEECSMMLKEFFKELREREKEERRKKLKNDFHQLLFGISHSN